MIISHELMCTEVLPGGVHTMGMLTAAAARAVPSSLSECARPCMAIGATSRGIAML